MKTVGVIGLKGLPAFGGAATVGENLIRELHKEYQFTVYSVRSHTQSAGEQNGYFQIVFGESYFMKFNIFFYYLKSALHSLLFARYDFIHLHHTDGAFILPLLRLRYKVICTSHAQPQVNEKWPWYVRTFFVLNEKIALSLSNTVTAVSKQLRETYSQKTRKPIHYIPNGINVQQEIAATGVSDEKFILFAAGRIIPLKGLHILLEAIKIAGIDIKLIVIGNLEQVQTYKNKILKLSKKVRKVEFIPLIREKKKLLSYVSQAELFIFPSYSENMSIMLLEAAYARTPIICSDIAANRAIFDTQDVIFFKTNDVTDLVEKLHFALKNTSALKQTAERTYTKVKQNYNWSHIAHEYKKLYAAIGEKNKN